MPGQIQACPSVYKWASICGMTYVRPERAVLLEPAHPMGERLVLIQLVMAYRGTWEIFIDEEDTWIAQGVTPSNRWARFEADNPRDLERQIEAV